MLRRLQCMLGTYVPPQCVVVMRQYCCRHRAAREWQMWRDCARHHPRCRRIPTSPCRGRSRRAAIV